MIGSTFGHYRILEKIGQGGMGEVFLADDATLQRKVALKFLPPDLQPDEAARKRFLREARSAAALDHPYICHINEVGEWEGRDYIAMEYVPGRSLAEALEEGPLPAGEALRTALEIAEALEAAHQRGIVHRDVKPGNVMLTSSGHAKVMDFGLAKQVAAAEGAQEGRGWATALTTEGAPLGTLAYMAPEQLRGQEADARSDVWALGATLYEMVAGALPFQGRSGFEVSEAILNQAPRPLPTQVPGELGAVIRRCLEKEPGRRYQTVAEVRGALEAVQSGATPPWVVWRYQLARGRWWMAGTALAVLAAVALGLDTGGIRETLTGHVRGETHAIRMAVLPFENLTGDPEQEYLSDGLTEEMITQLGRLHPDRLSVIGRPSVARYKGSDTPIDQIGRELGVEYVLAGSARRDSARVRVNAELIRVRGETQLWSQGYDRDLSGILSLQSDVARQVARALALRLLPEEEGRLANVRTINPGAYEAFQKGILFHRSLTEASLATAEEYFRLAIALDSTYAAPWAGIARVWTGRQQMGLWPSRDAFQRSRAAILRALALDEDEWEAHRALAGVLTWGDWDWPAAERQWNRVRELAPNHPETTSGHAHFLLLTGHPQEALAESERALRLDPFNTKSLGFHAMVLLGLRRFDDAITVGREALRLQPDALVARSALGDALVLAGREEDALALDRETAAGDAELRAALETGYREGGYAGAKRHLAEALAARFGQPGGVSAWTLAKHYLHGGDPDRALEWLERACQDGDGNLPYIAFPVWEAVRADPRFQDIWRRVGMPE